jgi:hypothetical protein
MQTNGMKSNYFSEHRWYNNSTAVGDLWPNRLIARSSDMKYNCCELPYCKGHYVLHRLQEFIRVMIAKLLVLLLLSFPLQQLNIHFSS